MQKVITFLNIVLNISQACSHTRTLKQHKNYESQIYSLVITKLSAIAALPIILRKNKLMLNMATTAQGVFPQNEMKALLSTTTAV